MGGRALRRIVVLVLVLAIVLVVADRVSDYIAERTAGDTIQSSQHLASRPDVDIAGFPFLDQLAAGSFDEITVTAHDVPLDKDARLLDISRIRVVLHHLSVSRDFSRVHAARADATARITFGDLGKALGIHLAYAGSGRVQADKKITVLGTTLHAQVTVEPVLVDGALSFTKLTVSNAGPLADAVAATLRQLFDLTLPLQGIPFRIRVNSLRVDDQGVLVTLTGSDLTYAK